jgi:hypothetical protein
MTGKTINLRKTYGKNISVEPVDENSVKIEPKVNESKPLSAEAAVFTEEKPSQNCLANVEPGEISSPNTTAVILPGNVQQYVIGAEINAYEDRWNEFKECLGSFNISVACQMIANYVSAFLNTEGGILYYGISDSGKVSGVKLARKSRDLFMRSFDGILNKFRPPVGPELYNIYFQPVKNREQSQMLDLYVIEVQVKQGDATKIYFTHRDQAFVKRDSSLSELRGPALVEFTLQRA